MVHALYAMDDSSMYRPGGTLDRSVRLRTAMARPRRTEAAAHSAGPEAERRLGTCDGYELKAKWPRWSHGESTPVSDSPSSSRRSREIPRTSPRASTMLWVKRRSRTGRDRRPFSIRNVPSRVIPVMIACSGCTSRTYQKRVMYKPRVMLAINSGTLLSPGNMARCDAYGPHVFGCGSE